MCARAAAVETLAPQQARRRARRGIRARARSDVDLRAGSDSDSARLRIPRRQGSRGLAGTGTVLTIEELLDAVSLMETVGSMRGRLCAARAKITPRLAERAASLAEFCGSFLLPYVARYFPNGEISDDVAPQFKAHPRRNCAGAHEKIQRSLEGILGARAAKRLPKEGRGLHHAPQRHLRDSGARFRAAQRSRRGPRQQAAHG